MKIYFDDILLSQEDVLSSEIIINEEKDKNGNLIFIDSSLELFDNDGCINPYSSNSLIFITFNHF